MTLSELGEEYLGQSMVISEQIHKLRPYLKTLKGVERIELERKLRKLYEMSLECKRTGNFLMDYYN